MVFGFVGSPWRLVLSAEGVVAVFNVQGLFMESLCVSRQFWHQKHPSVIMKKSPALILHPFSQVQVLEAFILFVPFVYQGILCLGRFL
jgi:hypothetical protein